MFINFFFFFFNYCFCLAIESCLTLWLPHGLQSAKLLYLWDFPYWNGLPFPSAGNLPNPGIEATSLVSPALAGGFFTTAPPVKPEFQAISELNIIGLIV